MPAVESLTAESVLLIVPSLLYLGWLEDAGEAAFGHAGAGHMTLMAGLGVITAVPLLLFGAAAPAFRSRPSGCCSTSPRSCSSPWASSSSTRP